MYWIRQSWSDGIDGVTGRATARGEVQACRWVEPDVAVRMLWPLRAEQLRGALTNRTPHGAVAAVAIRGITATGQRRTQPDSLSGAGPGDAPGEAAWAPG
jgi:hypothetical protein